MDEIKHCRLIEKLPEVSGFSLIIFPEFLLLYRVVRLD